MEYGIFARYYDTLIAGVSYKERADYLFDVFSRLQHRPGVTLDLACGTGNLTIELAKRGADVFGADASEDMLTFAQQKLADAGFSVLLLRQKMEELELYAPVDTVVCSLDSINHLETEQQVFETFRRVASSLNQGGYFVFDVNTVYKHREILGNHTFVYDMEEVFCVWQNSYEEKLKRVAISLDFFEHRGDVYLRSSEEFYERAYELETLKSLLERAGLHVAGVWSDMSFSEPGPQTERVVIAAGK